MIILDCEQKSEEWYQARCGIPTASNFSKIITTKGEPSKSQTDYMNELAYEAITGIPTVGYQSEAMKQGNEKEEEARNLYNFMYDVDVEQVGFVYRDDKKLYGCSPDGLVGDDGMVEIKCPLGKTHISTLLSEKPPCYTGPYFQQIQGNLFITDRIWCDFVSYVEGMDLFVERVERDDDFIKGLEFLLNIFCKNLREIIEKING